MMRTLPDRPGLYDPAYEHDACGVGFVADTTGAAGRRALVGVLFLPRDDAAAVARCRALVEESLVGQGLPLLGWRDVPVVPEVLGDQARAALPQIAQVFAGRPADL